jgi:cytochrome c biogenesis protein CcmG, thiol:disulfide interchange protein DsbE
MSHPSQEREMPSTGSKAMILFALLVMLFVAGVLVLRFRQSGEISLVGTRQLGVGRPLEPIALEPLLNSTKVYQLADLQGKVALINYWGPWCGPCLRELPELLALEKEYRENEQVGIFLVSSDGGSRQPHEEFKVDTQQALWQHNSDAPIYYDPTGQTKSSMIRSARLPQFGYPTTILIDSEGIIRGVWQGYDVNYVREMKLLMQRTLTPQKLSQ